MSQDIVLRRLEVLEQEVEMLKRQREGVARRDAQQFIATLVTIVVLLFGSAGFLGWQNARLMDQMEKRFGERITGVEKRVDQVEQNLTARLDQVEKRLDDRITGVETRLSDRITAVEKRLDQVEQNLTARFEDLRQVILSQQKQP